eukprot:11915814-Alexandrium_andersonii.AAC.1
MPPLCPPVVQGGSSGSGLVRPEETPPGEPPLAAPPTPPGPDSAEPWPDRRGGPEYIDGVYIP